MRWLRSVSTTIVLALWAISLSAQHTIDGAARSDDDWLASRNTANAQRSLMPGALEVGGDGILQRIGRGAPPALTSTRAGLQIFGDVALAFGTANLPAGSAREIRLWMWNGEAWRLSFTQRTMLAPIGRQIAIRVPQALPVDLETADRGRVLQMEQARLSALASADRHAYETLLGDDFTSVRGDGIFRTKLADVGLPNTYGHFAQEEVQVTILGPVAIVIGGEGVPASATGWISGQRFVRIWVLRGGTYYCVSQQATMNHAISPTAVR